MIDYSKFIIRFNKGDDTERYFKTNTVIPKQ